MPFIHSVNTALPPYMYTQKEILTALKDVWSEQFFNFERIEKFHDNVLVGKRYLSMPVEKYSEIFDDFGKKNDAYIKMAVKLAHECSSGLLDKAGLDAKEIDYLSSTTVTGLAVPSIEARLMNLMPFNPGVKRVPLFGLGCLAGVAGINRTVDYLKGHPKEAALFLSVELCSLTMQPDDLSVPNLISTGLFGDGAAAVLLVGDEHPLAAESPLEVVNTQSFFYPDTEKVMGWDIVKNGFKIVLGPDVPSMVKNYLKEDLDFFLDSNGLKRSDLDFFVAHPGGPKVLESIEETLELKKDALIHSWDCLEECGNMSSSSVLFILKKTLEKGPNKGTGLLSAMGPAFCSELTLVKG